MWGRAIPLPPRPQQQEARSLCASHQSFYKTFETFCSRTSLSSQIGFLSLFSGTVWILGLVRVIWSRRMPMDALLCRTDPRIGSLLAYLSQHDLHTEIRIETFAQRARLSTSRFRHLFTQATGVSFTRYVKKIRLAQARSFMEHSSLSVKEVSAAVGINDVSHFVRDYKILFGERPSESRRKQLLNSCLITPPRHS